MIFDSYCRIPRSVLSSTKITPAAKLVYTALSGYAWGEDDSAWPSVRRLARDTGLSPYGVQKALTQLKEAELVTIKHRKKHEGMEWNDTNLYTLKQPESTDDQQSCTGM